MIYNYVDFVTNLRTSLLLSLTGVLRMCLHRSGLSEVCGASGGGGGGGGDMLWNGYTLCVGQV